MENAEKVVKETNIRYGVVDPGIRAKYEKKYQVPYGYDHISFDEEKAISLCRKKRKGFIVEKVFDTVFSKNNKIEIFRGGKE